MSKGFKAPLWGRSPAEHVAIGEKIGRAERTLSPVQTSAYPRACAARFHWVPLPRKTLTYQNMNKL